MNPDQNAYKEQVEPAHSKALPPRCLSVLFALG